MKTPFTTLLEDTAALLHRSYSPPLHLTAVERSTAPFLQTVGWVLPPLNGALPNLFLLGWETCGHSYGLIYDEDGVEKLSQPTTVSGHLYHSAGHHPWRFFPPTPSLHEALLRHPQALRKAAEDLYWRGFEEHAPETEVFRELMESLEG